MNHGFGGRGIKNKQIHLQHNTCSECVQACPPLSSTPKGAPYLQAGEEGEQGVHPGACWEQGLVDVHVQQERRLADVLHDGGVVLMKPHRGIRGHRKTTGPFKHIPNPPNPVPLGGI